VGPDALLHQQSRRRLGLLAALLACAATAHAQDLSLARPEQYTENRGWNEAGLGPTWQIVVSATVAPSGFPTLVFIEQNGVREPMTQFGHDSYVHWKRFDPAFTGAWRIVAERSDAKGSSAIAPALAKPRQIPLAADVRVSGKGAEPRIAWKLPGGLDIERIRVGVRGGEKIQGRFLSLLQISDPLPPTATAFPVPKGWLKPGERYVFQVMLEDLEDGRVENRSLAFSDPYTP
jgi:hypothetical protein